MRIIATCNRDIAVSDTISGYIRKAYTVVRNIQRCMQSRRAYVAAVGATGAGLLAGCTGGNGDGSYPSQSITTIVPYGSGGATDTNYRSLNSYFEDELDVSVEIDNRPGAGGRTGMVEMYQARDDYTLAAISPITATIGATLFETPYTIEDLTTIGTSAGFLQHYFAEAGRWDDFQGFISWAEGTSETVNVGTVGTGSSTDFALVSHLNEIGIDNYELIPYDGTAQSGTAVARGDIDIGLGSGSSIVGLAEEGELDILMTNSADQTDTYFPNAPTHSDLGLEGLVEVPLPVTLFTHSGISDENVSVLEDALLAACENSEYQESAEEEGLTIFADSREETRENIEGYTSLAEQYGEIRGI